MGGAALLLAVLLLAALALGARPHRRDVARKLYLAGKRLEGWTPCPGVSAWELSGLVEGDLLPSSSAARMVYTEERRRWPNRTMPYIIERHAFEPAQVETILGVIQELNDVDCVILREATHNDSDYIRITGKAEGCHIETWGRQGGEQLLNLQPPACADRRTVFHMLFHALGFCHAHNNPIRDDYIQIVFDNVKDDKKNYLLKYKNDSRITDYGYRYDYHSIMHAGRRIYSKNNRDTIWVFDDEINIGVLDKPSDLDLHKLRKLYGCPWDPPIQFP